MTQPTKGMIEAEVANAVTRFQREQQGRGPSDVKAHIVADMVLVRCTGILTPTELHLVTTEEGKRLIRSARQELRTISQKEIEGMISAIVGCKVLRSYGDVNVEAAELIEVYILEENVERRFPPSTSRDPSKITKPKN